MNHNIENLLLKFHSNEISLEELKELADATSNSRDEELHSILHKHWNEYEENQPLSYQKQVALYSKLQKKIRSPWYVNMKKHGFRVAASLLLLLTSSLMLMYYVEHKELQELANDSVMISSGESGFSSVMLPDGTKVLLNMNSSLSYQRDFGRKERRVQLLGEGYFEVERNVEKQFIVATDFMDITVLGTTFNLYAYENKEVLEMSLIEGSVQVSTKKPPYETVAVKPNEKITYNKRTRKLNLEHTTNRIETAWLQKKLVFRNETLQNVLNCLERKYDVKFTINDSRLLNDVYTGVFDEEKIEKILRILQFHYGFEYTINEQDISIVIK